jgi:signal transduction histidine kinase
MWVCVLLTGSLLAVLAVVHMRVERTRKARLSESARREGAALAARAVRHHLANKLAVTVGYSEVLADDPRLPHDLAELAERIKASALSAAEAVHRLKGTVLRVQLDTRLSGPTMLDLDASIGPDSTERQRPDSLR